MRWLGICAWLTIVWIGSAQDLQQRVAHLMGAEWDQKTAKLIGDRRFEEVETLLASRQPASPELRREKLAVLGALEFLNGHLQNAVDQFQGASALSPLAEPDRFTLAMALVRLGRDEDARSELAKLSQQHGDNALYTYWLGRIDYDERRYQEAVDHLKKAADLDPKSARAWDSLGLAYDMKGDSADALRALQESARMNRGQAHGSPWPPHDLGALLLRMGQVKEAEQALREALRYDPEMEQAHYHLGRALEKDGADSEAAKEYMTALNEDTHASDVCYSLAMLYRKLHRDQDAEKMFGEWRKRRNAQP